MLDDLLASIDIPVAIRQNQMMMVLSWKLGLLSYYASTVIMWQADYPQSQAISRSRSRISHRVLLQTAVPAIHISRKTTS